MEIVVGHMSIEATYFDDEKEILRRKVEEFERHEYPWPKPATYKLRKCKSSGTYEIVAIYTDEPAIDR